MICANVLAIIFQKKLKKKGGFLNDFHLDILFIFPSKWFFRLKSK